MAAELRRQGVEPVVVDVEALELPPGGDAADLAELPGGELPLVEDGEAPAAEPAEFWTLPELRDPPEFLKPPPCLVPRLAWRGRLAVLADGHKTGKSTLLSAAASAASRGWPFLDGRPTFPQR